jgi:hypothetical protein
MSNLLRRICKLADQPLDQFNPTFCRLCALQGRRSGVLSRKSLLPVENRHVGWFLCKLLEGLDVHR